MEPTTRGSLFHGNLDITAVSSNWETVFPAGIICYSLTCTMCNVSPCQTSCIRIHSNKYTSHWSSPRKSGRNGRQGVGWPVWGCGWFYYLLSHMAPTPVKLSAPKDQTCKSKGDMAFPMEPFLTFISRNTPRPSPCSKKKKKRPRLAKVGSYMTSDRSNLLRLGFRL